MINHATLAYLKQIRRNDSKIWYEAHLDQFEQVKTDLVNVAGRLLAAVCSFDPVIQNAHIDPRKTISRIHRDMRFAHNKPPYKSDMFIALNPGKKATMAAGYYFHIEPDNCYAAAGIYTTPPEALLKIRRKIESAFPDWQKIVEGADFKRTLPDGLTSPRVLRSAPRGFAPDSPAIEYLKRDGYCTKQMLSDSEIAKSTAEKKVLAIFRASQPLVSFLNHALAE